VNVLLTCVGLRVDVVQAFREAVERGGDGGVVIGTDMQELAPAVHFCDRWERMPIATDPAYADLLLDLAERHGVRCVVPCSEFDLIALADARERFHRIGVEVFIPDPEPTRLTVDKLEMARFLDRRDIPSPRTFAPDELPDDLRYPVLVKMREGMGSKHIHRCRDRRELDFFLGYAEVASMVQEACQGEEFSIDLLCDVDGRCLEAIPRTMIQSKGGEQIKGTTILDEELIQVGRRVAEALPLRGFGTVQCFRVAPDRHEITDVNPRVGGAFPLPLAAGGDFPALVLAMAAGERVEPRLGTFRPGVTLSRFFHQIVLERAPDGDLAARLDRLTLPGAPTSDPSAPRPRRGDAART
jgi:carbamoyl-phosphate synthase large subunit